jgi:hypothetical protein
MKANGDETESMSEAIALLRLPELSEADVAAGRLFSTREAFERARRAIVKLEEPRTP